ncbi:hypothetical protein ACYJW8_04905 [Frateuria aurantia]
MLTLALILGIGGSGLCYLSHPNQNLLRCGLPRSCRLLAGLLLLGGLLCWCWQLGISAGLFAWLVTIMLSWVIPPYLGWLLGARQAAPDSPNR